ncbi:MAG TPA: hypothetical protein VFJ93_03370 [Gaiellaceae bacterium]|nr:hypothetical protein [Gaiellaceae bacterium]
MDAPVAAPSYPAFIPPGGLATTRPQSWSRAEADDYAAWLKQQVVPRVLAMHRYFRVNEPASVSTLRELEKILSTRLREAPFAERVGEQLELSPAGYAAAADMGLLIAQLLLETGRMTWKIVRRPRTDVSFNQPVLTGFPTHEPFNPIWAALGPAHRILGGRVGPNWSTIYSYALDHLGEAPST